MGGAASKKGGLRFPPLGPPLKCYAMKELFINVIIYKLTYIEGKKGYLNNQQLKMNVVSTGIPYRKLPF